MMTTTWYSLPSDIVTTIFSLIEPHYAILLINREITCLKERWLAMHFQRQFGLPSTRLGRGGKRDYLSFYADNRPLYNLDTTEDHRSQIWNFKIDPSRKTYSIPPTNDKYYRFLIHSYCESINLDHASVDSHKTIVPVCVCGGRKFNRDQWGEGMICNNDQCYSRIRRCYAIVDYKEVAYKGILITKKEISRREQKKRQRLKK